MAPAAHFTAAGVSNSPKAIFGAQAAAQGSRERNGVVVMTAYLFTFRFTFRSPAGGSSGRRPSGPAMFEAWADEWLGRHA
jgi:hypothetical protein